MLHPLRPLLLGLAATLAACAPRADAPEALVARARAAHGSAILDTAAVRFAFRGACYRVVPGPQGRTVTHVYHDTVRGETGPLVLPLVETLGPSGVARGLAREGRRLPTPEGADARAIETQLNSIAYFALLPYNLADPAVQLKRLPDATIQGQPYATVEVTFAQDGGGRDWEDRFVYWLHRDRHTLDYLAYLYHTGEGGTRFRVARNPRTVGGVRWQDYDNLTDPTLGNRIEAYPERLGAATLQRVSDVVLERVEVGGDASADLLAWCEAGTLPAPPQLQQPLPNPAREAR